jgi:hypothetical protein
MGFSKDTLYVDYSFVLTSVSVAETIDKGET